MKLEMKDSGLAPGQFAAFYLGEECLGSGVISSSDASSGGRGGGNNVAVRTNVVVGESVAGAAVTATDGAALPASFSGDVVDEQRQRMVVELEQVGADTSIR